MKQMVAAFAAAFAIVGSLTFAWGEGEAQRVFDNADIFTEEEESLLEKRIDKFQVEVQADAVILTEKDGSVQDPELRAQDYYEAGGFGLGEQHSGIILYINMETRDIAACASGETKYVLLRTDLDTVIDAGYENLGSAEYADSMAAMLGEATSVIKRHEISGEYENGKYTGPHTAPDDRPARGYPTIFLVAAVVLGGACTVLVYVFVSHRYANPVREAVYNVQSNTQVDLTTRQDIFVNKTMSVRSLPKNPPSQLGSSGFRSSSSGRSFSSSSRKF